MNESERTPRRTGIGVDAATGPKRRLLLVVDDGVYDVTADLRASGVAPKEDDPVAAFARPAELAEWTTGAAADVRSGRARRARVPEPEVFAPPFDLRRLFKVPALGRSYRAHALELGNEPVERPIVFEKLPEFMVGSGAVVRIPHDAEGKLDHEAELVVILGKDAVDLPEGRGAAAIAGYCASNDLTLRAVQAKAKQAGRPWFRAKNFPGSFPIGPWLTPASAVPRPDRLVITCRVAGEIRQRAPVSEMTWDAGRVVEELSRLWPLRAGDAITTGTPAGVSGLAPGTTCVVEVASDEISLGTLVTRIAES